eukprot:SM000252S09070  [mRNA]  locus=s252:139781:140259:+ [translate_table: standard]
MDGGGSDMVGVAEPRAASRSPGATHWIARQWADLGEFLELRVSPHAEEAQHAGSEQREEDGLAAQRA